MIAESSGTVLQGPRRFTIWDVSDGLKWVKTCTVEPVWSPDGKWLVTGDDTGADLLEAGSLTPRGSLRNSDDFDPYLWVSSGGRRYPTFVFAPDSKTLVVTGLPNQAWDPPFKDWRSGKFNLTGSPRFYSVTRLWDVETQKELLALPGCNQALYSPDGKTLATVREDGTIQLWDVPPRKPWGLILGLSAGLWLVVLVSTGLFRKWLGRRLAAS